MCARAGCSQPTCPALCRLRIVGLAWVLVVGCCFLEQVFSKDHTARFSELHQDYYNNKCDDVLSIQIAEKYGGVCWRIIKNVPVVVPIPEFEVALVEGLDHFRRTVYKPNA
jgi:hypothetical protein